MIRPLDLGPRQPAESTGRRAQPSSFADVMDAVQRRCGDGAGSSSRDATRVPADRASARRPRPHKAAAAGSPDAAPSPDHAAASRDAAAAAAAPAVDRQDAPTSNDQGRAAGDSSAAAEEHGAAQPRAVHGGSVDATTPLPGPPATATDADVEAALDDRLPVDAETGNGLPGGDVALVDGRTAGGVMAPAGDAAARAGMSPAESVQGVDGEPGGGRLATERDDNAVSASPPLTFDPAVPGAAGEEHRLSGDIGDLASGQAETAGSPDSPGLSAANAPADAPAAGTRPGNAAAEARHEPPAVSLQEPSRVAVRSGMGSSGAAGPALSGSVERVVALVEQLRHAPPPRTVTVDLEGLGGTRVVVALRGEAVTVAPVAGAPLDTGFNSDLSRSLAERGLHLAGEGSAGGSGRRPQEEEHPRPSDTDVTAPRRPAFGRSRRDDGIRL